MTTPLVQRLSLVVDATTGNTETRMDALAASSRQAGEAAERSASQVAAAAERVAAAQLRRDDAAGKVAIAEARLVETQERGNASTSQLLAATERLESARRQLAVAERQVETAQAESVVTQGRAVEAASRATTETERARLGAEGMRSQLDGLKDVAAGLTAFAVGDWARDQVDAYLEGARGAQQLASSMNATIQQGGQLTALFSSLGLESDDLLEIQAEFAQKAGSQGQALEAFGASLQKNRDGTINWASTLTDALTQLQKIPDATERNRLGFQLFGEEGYKQLSRLLTSGVSVQEALDRVGTPFTAEDVATAQQFDRDMTRLSLSGSELGRSLARDVVPALADLAEMATGVLGVVSAIPLPMALATTAAIAMGRTGFDPLAKISDLASTGLQKVRDGIASAASGVEEGAGRIARAGGLARGAVGGLTDALGGPVGVAAIGASAAYALAASGEEALETHARDAAVEIERLGGTSNDTAANSRRMAQQLRDEAGAWETLAASTRGAAAQREELTGWRRALAETSGAFAFTQTGVTSALADEDSTARGFQEAIEEARKELGELGAQQEVTSQTSRSLTDLIAQGTISGTEFAGAVRDSAHAQAEQAQTSDTATAAVDAYRSQTDQAVQAVRGLIDAQLSQQDAGYAFLSAMDALNSATDDAKTSVNEVAQAHTQLQEAALRAGDAAADAAVAQARAAGEIVTPLDEAKTRADALITDLTARLNTPGLSKGAKEDLQGLIDQLTQARDKGDVNALVTLTGADTAQAQLDEATADRQTQVTVESRGGPAVDAYLDGLAEDRLALVRTESRGGPAVDAYLDGLAEERLAIVRTESRNGPAVDAYLDGLAHDRLAIIRVETRGGPDVDTYLDNLAGRRRTAVIDVQARGGAAAGFGGAGAPLTGAGIAGGPVTVQVYPQVDSSGRLSAQALQLTGRQVVQLIRDYERQNGTGWRRYV